MRNVFITHYFDFKGTTCVNNFYYFFIFFKYISIQYATVDVHYLPLFPAVVCPGLFIAPVFSTFFPLLPSDVPRLQKFLRGIVCL